MEVTGPAEPISPDPVVDAERRCNDVIFGWQDNRNPFVDHPEWVRSIWASCR